MTIALCLAGCASSRKSVAESEASAAVRKDSTVEEVRTLRAATVPMETVTLTIAADSLRKLPVGASYSARSGRASVEVRKGRTADTLVVYASCDSLQRMVEEYERRLKSHSKETEESKETTETAETRKPPDRWWAYMATFIAGLVSGAVITHKIKKK